MKEYPILFSGPDVRAILAGRKTQTRRVVNPQPPEWLTGGREAWNIAGDLWGFAAPGHTKVCHSDNTIRCPYGKPGDRLWVREKHAWADNLADGFEREDPVVVAYHADQIAIKHESGNVHELDCYSWNWEHSSLRWRPSIHMPKWACRLWLEVVDVRVERLQDISEADAVAEGFKPIPHFMGGVALEPPIVEFRRIWDSLNAKKPGCSGEDNPWAWVGEFTVGL